MLLANERYNSWKVLDKAKSYNYYKCECDCGYKVEIHTTSLKNNSKKCKRCEYIEKNKKYINTKHGNWLILEIFGISNRYLPSKVKCRCDCGHEKILTFLVLMRNTTKCCINCREKLNLLDMTFGKLEVISFHSQDKNRKNKWLCKCICGNHITVRGSDLVRNKSLQCKECKNKEMYQGEGYLSGSYMYKTRTGAIIRNLSFEVDIKYLWNLFIEQNMKCFYTDLPITLQKNAQKLMTTSLDRTDSTKGYIPGNVKWVHKSINRIKQNFSEKEFINFCQLVAIKHPKQ